MLHQKPVITCNIGAMQSIIDDNINGILIPPGSSKALSDAVRQIYFNESKCRDYGGSGCDKAYRLYSRENIYKDLMNIYRQAGARL